MFNKKHKALLFGFNDRDAETATYKIVGPLQRRLARIYGADVIVLNDDGSVSGTVYYTRWEPLS